MALEARVILQTDELDEARELFAQWYGRTAELPEWLRRKLDELSVGDLAELRSLGGDVYDVAMLPEARAVIAQLRALGRHPAP